MPAAEQTSQIESQIRQYLVDQLGTQKDIGANDPLFSAGVLDSFDIVQVLEYINSQFGVQISPLDVNLDNFDSIARMCDLVVKQNAPG